MTYNAIEISDYSASPVELYSFTRLSNRWDYNTSNIDLTIDTRTYFGKQIKRERFKDTNEMSKQNLTINCDINLSILDQFKLSSLPDVLEITIKQFHRSDGDSELVTVYVGRVIDVKFLESEAQIYCESIQTSLKRAGLRRFYQSNCPHVLYGDRCGVNRADFSVPGIITTISGSQLTATAFGIGDDYLSGGFIELQKLGVIHRRSITKHTGTTIFLNYPFEYIDIADSVVVYPGCNHTLAVCISKFSNELNYGGQSHYPGVNPLGSVSVF